MTLPISEIPTPAQTSTNGEFAPVRNIPDAARVAMDQLNEIEREVKRRQYLKDPVLWAKERLGDTLWSKQVEIILAVRDNRRVAVMSCHEIGKSFIASVITAWWLDTHRPGDAFVVTSAPSGPQVKSILWREISRCHARGKLRGRTNQVEWFMEGKDGNEELVAMGRKPDEYNPMAFQGIHARFVLVIFDEANGIRGALHEAADSLIANDEGKFLMIGNPDDPSGEFYEACQPGSGYKVISVGAFDTPNFTGEEIPKPVARQLIGKIYVEEKRKKWAKRWTWNEDGSRVLPPEDHHEGETNPYWFSKVLGEFPTTTEEGGLIPLAWIRAAQARNLQPSEPNELGVDVGAGGDSSTGCHRRGPVARILWEDKNPDTMVTCGNAVHHMNETGAELVKVDTVGIGKGVVDRGRELKHPFVPVNVGMAPKDPKRFFTARDENWWEVREMFEAGLIDLDPDDEDLAAELVQIRYRRESNGKIKVESKKEALKRGVKSPNRADALMLAYARETIKKRKATWGSRAKSRQALAGSGRAA